MRQTFKIFFLSFLAGSLLAAAALAKKPEEKAKAEKPKAEVATSKPDAAALEIAKMMVPKDQYDQMVKALVQMGLNFAQADAQQASKTVDAASLEKKLEPKVKKAFPYSYFTDQVYAPALMKSFAAKERTDILVFLKTEAGKKWFAETPKVAQTAMGDIQTRVHAELPKLAKESLK